MIALFLVVQTALVVTLIVFRYDLLRPIGETTNWLVAPDLVSGLLLLFIIAGGIFLGLGRLQPHDIGLRASDIPAALLVTAAFWIVTQAVLVGAALLQASPVALHPDWHTHGANGMIGFLIAMLFGMALYEEVAFRGFLFPQLHLKLGRRHLWLAALVSQILFALVHLPTRALIAQVSANAMILHVIVLTLAGLIGVLLYVRTRNLLVVAGVHALVNAPTPLVASPVHPLFVTALLSAVLIARPELVRRP